MCIGIPARVLSIQSGPIPMARLNLAGQEMDCCLAYVPEAAVGDYVLVQNGFAMELLDPQAATESFAAFESLGLDLGTNNGAGPLKSGSSQSGVVGGV